jgi:DNA (cytosine-5)-methyltransferase 1
MMDFQTTAVQLSVAEDESNASDEHRVEVFAFDRATNELVRHVKRRNGSTTQSRVLRNARTKLSGDVGAEYDLAWLRSSRPPNMPGEAASSCVRIADLFSGCGGLSLGVAEACRALEMQPSFVFASDINEAALDVYKKNFEPVFSSHLPLEIFVDGKIGTSPTRAEQALKKQLGRIDFVVAGPPCQGHSDLNNHTRRDDPKNQLVVRVARFVELFKPMHVLIENVQGIRHDHLGSLSSARRTLQKLGYSLSEAILRADDVGVAQARKRFFLLASQNLVQDLDALSETIKNTHRPLQWAIGDLLNKKSTRIFDNASTHSVVNQSRINYLFDHDLYELPNSERPPCHRDKPHSYFAVYGRMHWDKAAPTITTGFGSTGQGRFVHPLERRTLTPHEAARIQFFPDFFDFGERGRRDYQELIGNAVPSKLAYSIALHQLR